MHDLKTGIEQLRKRIQTNHIKPQLHWQILNKFASLILGEGHSSLNSWLNIKELSADDKKIFGPLLNEFKKWAEEIYEASKKKLEQQQLHMICIKNNILM